MHCENEDQFYFSPSNPNQNCGINPCKSSSFPNPTHSMGAGCVEWVEVPNLIGTRNGCSLNTLRIILKQAKQTKWSLNKMRGKQKQVEGQETRKSSKVDPEGDKKEEKIQPLSWLKAPPLLESRNETAAKSPGKETTLSAMATLTELMLDSTSGRDAEAGEWGREGVVYKQRRGGRRRLCGAEWRDKTTRWESETPMDCSASSRCSSREMDFSLLLPNATPNRKEKKKQKQNVRTKCPLYHCTILYLFHIHHLHKFYSNSVKFIIFFVHSYVTGFPYGLNTYLLCFIVCSLAYQPQPNLSFKT